MNNRFQAFIKQLILNSNCAEMEGVEEGLINATVFLMPEILLQGTRRYLIGRYPVEGNPRKPS